MGVFLNWLTENLVLQPIEMIEPTKRSNHTTMAEKVEMAGGVANFRQLVDEYREKAGDSYSTDEDPLFMDIDKFKNIYFN